MKSLHLVRMGFLILAGAVFCHSLPGQGHGGRHMGGPPSWSGGGHSGTGSQTQSQTTFPKQLANPNSKLSTNLQTLLPKGTTPQQACTGFRNLGQCVAAIHVSHNLGITFADLKAKMTGSNPESLGKAIQDLKPSANSTAEKNKAQKQAKDDMNESES